MAENNAILFERDKLARERIKKDIDTNFFVEAGAGSGKTTALVGRMAALVLSGVSVEKICAITFTRAAANEFRDRFRRRLSELSRDPKLTAEERSRCEDALRNIDLCFTGTIDSFCSTILSEHPLEAGVIPGSSICPASDLKKLYLAEYRRAAKGGYGDVLQKKYYRFCSVHSNPAEVFTEHICDFMDTRNAVLTYDRPDDIPFDEDSADKKAFVDMLQYIHEHPEVRFTGKGDAEAKRQKAAAAIPEHLRKLRGRWQDNISDLSYFFRHTVGKITISKNPGEYFLSMYGEYLEADVSNSTGNAKSYSIDVRKASSPARKLLELQHAVTLDFMNHFVREVADELKKTGQLSYFDCLLYLRDMLRKDAEQGGTLIRHITDRHSYYLIDEFQDTNPMQAEVFFYLTAIEPQADWRRCVPRPGSLFIVGDPKQSIYRFRSADVESYLRVRDMFSGQTGEVLALTRNFRSTRELCGWFNGVFPNLIIPSSSQCGYEPIPMDESTPEEIGSLHGVFSFDVTSAPGTEQLADMIEWLVGSGHTLRGLDGAVRPVRFGDIMVITPSTTHLGQFIGTFKERGIPAFVEGSTLFDSCCVLCEASKVLCAIAFPTDTTRVYEALRGRGLAVDDEAVRGWRVLNRKFTLFSASEDERFVYEPVNKALLELRELASDAKQMTVTAALTTIIDRLGLYEKCGSDNLEYLHYALELLRTAEADGSVASLQEGARLISDLLSDRAEGVERCMSLVRESDRVHLANMHKVKGLEAPIVILADPNSFGSPASLRIDHSGTEPFCCRFRLPKDKDVYSDTVAFAAEREAEKDAFAEELDRLRYVSATRARDVLIIADQKLSKGDSSTSNIWFRLLGAAPSMEPLDFPSPSEDSGEAVPDTQPSAADILAGAERDSVFADRRSEEKTYAILRPSQIKLRSTKADDDEPRDREEKEQEEQLRSELHRRNAAVIGSMVHRLMEVLASSRGRADTAMLVQSIRQEFYHLIAGDDNELTALLSTIAARITDGGFPQTNGVPDDILGELAKADTVLCEVPFCLSSEKDGTAAVSSGVMDLVYRKEGEWHIIDYKTGEKHSDLDQHYAPQLEAYREAFLALTGHQADAKVYHIDTTAKEGDKNMEKEASLQQLLREAGYMTVDEAARQMADDLIEEGFTKKDESYEEFVEYIALYLRESTHGVIMWPVRKREEFDSDEEYIFSEPIGQSFTYDLYECQSLAYLDAFVSGEIEERLYLYDYEWY